jgi:DNA-binding CsgD family transcriptional regulator
VTQGVVAQLVKGHLSGATVDALAETFGLHRSTVLHHLQRQGIFRRRPSSEDIQTAARLYADGLSLAAIGSRLGFHASTIHNLLRQQGVVLRRPWER